MRQPDPRGSIVAVLTVFAGSGLVWGQTLARMPALRDAVGADKAQLGLALMGAGIGSVLSMPFTGRLVDRFGSRRVVATSIVLCCLAYASLALVPTVVAMIAAFVAIGLAVGVWDVGMNIQGSYVERQRPRSWMSYFHAAFSGGAVIGAGLGALAAHLQIGLVQLAVVPLVVMGAGLAATWYFVPERSPDHAGPEPPGKPGRISGLELIIGAVCLTAALAEGAADDWLALLLVDVHSAPEAFGALTLAAFNITMTIGRLTGGLMIDRFDRVAVVRVGALVAVVGILLVTQVPSLAVAIIGGLLWGLGISTIFPASISAAGELPGRGNRGITVVTTIAYGAFLVGAPTIGLVAESIGLERALLIIVGVLLVTTVIAPALRRRGALDAPGAGR